MKRFGLLGKDISYSLSPALHKDIMQNLHIDGTFELFDVEENRVPEILALMREKKIDGLSVTIPYKIKVIGLLDDLSPEAEAIGAVNCILNREGKLIGYNTDYFGIMDSFEKLELNLLEKSCFILGTGGASKAALKALKDRGAHITLVSRDPERDLSLFPGIKIISYDELATEEPHGYLLINCTPVGNTSSLADSPVPKEIAKNFEYIFDMIYRPELTKLLSFAKSKEKCLNGMTMLTAQAVKAQKLWNNKEPQ